MSNGDPCFDAECAEALADYTLGTFECRLLREGDAEEDEFVLGNVVIGSIVDGGEHFPSFDSSPSVDTRYICVFRNRLVVRVAVDEINPLTLATFFDTTNTPVAGGYDMVWQIVNRREVYRVTLEHEMPCRDATITVVLHRASVAQPVEIPFSIDAVAAGEIEFNAMYCPAEAEPFGYIRAVGDFNVGTI
jgi:hypothetical protein